MMLHLLLRPARAFLALTLASALLAACGSSNRAKASLGRDPLAAIDSAMRAAGSGRVSGSTTDAKGASLASLTGSFDGGLSGHGQAETQFVTAQGTKVPTELRWIANTVYFTRSTATVPTGEALSVFTRPANAKPWRKLVNVKGQIVAALPSAFSPMALVEWLRSLHVPVSTHSGDSVGKSKTTRVTTTRLVAAGVWVGATVDLWVDDHARVLRVRIVSPGGGLQYDVHDFGAAVHVDPPPAAQIATVSELRTPEPQGQFATVRSGATNGVTWALQRAPGTLGTVCWRWQASAPLPQAGVSKTHGSSCLAPPPGQSSDPSDYVQFVVVGNGTGSYDALAVVLPPGVKKLTFGFVGGKTEDLTPAPNLVWVGATTPFKAYLGVTLADGTHLDCGAGAVSSVGDLTDPKATSNLGSAPWGCIPPA